MSNRRSSFYFGSTLYILSDASFVQANLIIFQEEVECVRRQKKVDRFGLKVKRRFCRIGTGERSRHEFRAKPQPGVDPNLLTVTSDIPIMATYESSYNHSLLRCTSKCRIQEVLHIQLFLYNAARKD